MALGDGSAHVDMLCDAGYPTYLLGTWVRERQALTLEEGVRRLTPDPAEVFGIRDRGRLAPGLAADLAIFDAARVGSTKRGERRFDLPGGAKRMVMPSRGVEYTVVNGVVTWADGKLTGASPTSTSSTRNATTAGFASRGLSQLHAIQDGAVGVADLQRPAKVGRVADRCPTGDGPPFEDARHRSARSMLGQ